NISWHSRPTNTLEIDFTGAEREVFSRNLKLAPVRQASAPKARRISCAQLRKIPKRCNLASLLME
ncbi:hypothetical protein D6817_03460, partial [Candidatus Pacearchaeota archaeon]